MARTVENLVQGYMVQDHAARTETLYAKFNDGRVAILTDIAMPNYHFNVPGAAWEIHNGPVPEHAEWVGNYEPPAV